MAVKFISSADIDEFRGFCRNATDSQLDEIERKERNAGRIRYAKLAEDERLARKRRKLN